MSALIWKELRENIGWALLAMLALGGAEIYALYHQQYPGQQDFGFYEGITLCKKPFLMVTMFGCAAVGLALGFLQVLPELKRDRWAALLHRPISRGRFFWGKAIAGLLLYLVAAGVPFLVSIWHVATPGNFATPFVPEMIRPGLADLVAGLAYYFAALLVALQGGGVLLRAVPLLAAVHVSFAALEVELFRVAVLSAAGLALALCLAGWGAIHARESLRGRPRLGHLALLVAVFYGTCGLGDLGEKLGAMAGRMGDQKFSNWDILDNGVPVRVDYVNDVLVATTDVNGQPFADPKYRPDLVRSHTLGMNITGSYIGDTHGWHPRRYARNYRESYTYLYALEAYSHPRLEQWFRVYDGHRYVGMLLEQKMAFAQLGADGFAPLNAQVLSFPEDTRTQMIGGDMLMIVAPEYIRFVRLARQEIIEAALAVPGPIYGMCHAWARTATSSVTFQGVAFRTAMAVYKADGRVAALLPYHQDVDRWGKLSLGVLKTMDRFVLQYEPSDWIEGSVRRAMPQYVETMDAQGNVLAAFTLPPSPPNVNPPTWSGYLAPRLESPAFFFGEMVYVRLGAAFGSSRLREALDKQLGRDFQKTFQVGSTIVLLALALSVITFFWARRAQLSNRLVWAWTASVLALGLPGFLIFWLAGERPRTVPCPACQRPRHIDGEACTHCGAAWPPPPADDTAIFDRAPAATSI